MSVDLLVANLLPIAAELHEALDKTAAVLSKAVACFRAELQRPDSPAGFTGPIR